MKTFAKKYLNKPKLLRWNTVESCFVATKAFRDVSYMLKWSTSCVFDVLEWNQFYMVSLLLSVY